MCIQRSADNRKSSSAAHQNMPIAHAVGVLVYTQLTLCIKFAQNYTKHLVSRCGVRRKSPANPFSADNRTKLMSLIHWSRRNKNPPHPVTGGFCKKYQLFLDLHMCSAFVPLGILKVMFGHSWATEVESPRLQG